MLVIQLIWEGPVVYLGILQELKGCKMWLVENIEVDYFRDSCCTSYVNQTAGIIFLNSCNKFHLFLNPIFFSAVLFCIPFQCILLDQLNLSK